MNGFEPEVSNLSVSNIPSRTRRRAKLPRPKTTCDLPLVETSDRQLREITADALGALRLGNTPPTIYVRGGALVRLEHGDASRGPRVVILAGNTLRYHLARAADWVCNGRSVAPPAAVVRDVEATPALTGFPALDAVVTHPVAVPPGQIVATPGYHAGCGLWYEQDPELQPATFPPEPGAADVRAARALVEDNLFTDFPFVDDGDRAVAWACLLLPFLRPLVQGPTPLHLFSAPMPGTGKTLLSQAILIPARGRQPLEALTVDCDEPEVRKRLTSTLRDAPGVVLLDNLGQGRRLESSSLSAALTAEMWADRLLGASVKISLPVRCTWVGTGNNPRLSDELLRRTVCCRLDAGRARPHLRTGFKHDYLLSWARDRRSELISAALTLIQAWLVGGRPEGDIRLGMFENWARVVGGVLDVAGIMGLAEAVSEFQGGETESERTLAPFLHLWRERYGDRAVGVKDLSLLAEAMDNPEAILDVHLGERVRERSTETARSRQTRLGLALLRLSGQVHCGYTVQPAGADRSARQLYRLAAVVAGARPAAT